MIASERATHRILVTDGDQRASLAVVRSLGAAGHTVYVCAPTRNPLAGTSRFSQASRVVANALDMPDHFADDVLDLVNDFEIDILIPMTEAALLALLPRRDRFAHTIIPFAGIDVFESISYKEAVLNAAAKVGIAVPTQTVLPDAASLEVLNATTLSYPVVVKPARSVSTGPDGRIKLTVRHAAGEDELRDILAKMDARAYPLLIQQRIIGPGIGIFVLLWGGNLIAQFAHRRIREKPPAGGISVYRESIPVDPLLLRASLALLAEFNWHGVAMIEYKLDEQTGTPYLMEINGRFWGSLQLAIDSGVDFPRLLIGVATGEPTAAVTNFQTGVRSRWFWGDVDHLLTRMIRSNERLSMPPGAPSRWRAVRDFFTHHTNDISEVWKLRDMRPFLRESVQWFHQLLR